MGLATVNHTIGHESAPAPHARWVLLVVLVMLSGGCGQGAVGLEPVGLASTPSPPAAPSPSPAMPSVAPAPSPTATSVEPPPAPVVEDDEDACPEWVGLSERYVVGFHEYPAGLEVGQEFACGRILETDEPHPIAFIVVEVWDEEDFMARVFEDPNVRYAERDGEVSTQDGSGDAGGGPSEP
jgi:hypothetical protein